MRGGVLGGSGLAVDLPLGLWRQHLVLLVAVALAAFVVVNGAEQRLLWRVQLTALYGVRAIAKVNESFLGGDVLFGAVVAAPLWSSLLSPPPTALLIGAALRLVVFGGTAVLLHAASAHLIPMGHSRTPSRVKA